MFSSRTVKSFLQMCKTAACLHSAFSCLHVFSLGNDSCCEGAVSFFEDNVSLEEHNLLLSSVKTVAL